MPSGEAPEESLSIETQGCFRARTTSGSDIPNTATPVDALSSINRSNKASIASLFQTFATSAKLLPCIVPIRRRLHELFADAIPQPGVLQTCDQLGGTAVMSPRWNKSRQIIE